MSGFESRMPFTAREMVESAEEFERRAPGATGCVVRRVRRGALTREAAAAVLDMLGLLPTRPAEAAGDERTAQSAVDDTPEPAETVSADPVESAPARPCKRCGQALTRKQKQFCSRRCYVLHERAHEQPCGSQSGAGRHRRRGEPVCQECRAAERAAARAARAAWRARREAVPEVFEAHQRRLWLRRKQAQCREAVAS